MRDFAFCVEEKQVKGFGKIGSWRGIKSIFKVAYGENKDCAMYNETKYVVYTSHKLHLNFYIDVLKVFMKKKDLIFNVFVGSKVLYAGMVSI